MYLKRLELQGFKSFQGRTVLDFEPGITAVVGPNGSGKSNVAESLRWVLGEQSSRSLRARRLEDVIFSGSSTRAAVGMAEVSITLDNSEGWLPIDYSEVVVSRRVFRSGESEYLINRNKVRLRDVLDLFLRAQVGQNGYAFMGQGLVEEVLLMRPEERRRLLEDAADVRLLRNRLDEARDRLAATRENLERVRLLIDEIAPRLRQLERQAGRAAEHAVLARELAATLQELYGQMWKAAQEALTAAEAAKDQQQQRKTVAEDTAKAREETLATITAALEEREKELSASLLRLRGLQDQVRGLEQRLEFGRERLQSQTSRRQELLAEIESLRTEISELQAGLAANQERARSIQPEIEAAAALIGSRRQELNSLEQEQSALRRRIADGEEAVLRSRNVITQAEAALRRLAEEESRGRGEVDRRGGQKHELLKDLARLRGAIRERGSRLAGFENDIEEGEQERVGLTAMVESSRNAVFRLEGEVVALNAAASQLAGQQELLLRMQNAQEGVDAGARFLLGDPDSTASRDVAEGLVGLVRDLIRVKAGLERAIDAALAENVNTLVFENINAALAAIEQLESRGAGRATVIPLDQVRVSPPLALLGEKGIVGVASRLVACENEYRPLIDSLLGRTIVVENVNLARDILKRGLGAVVTLDGVLLRPGGTISGGMTGAVAESFSRQRELDELPQQIAALEASREELSQRLQREQETLAGAAAALARLQPRVESQRAQRATEQAALMEDKGRFILVRSEMRAFWQDRRRREAQRDWRSLRQAHNHEREAQAIVLAEVEADLQRDSKALVDLLARRSGMVDALSESVAAHAGLEGESRSLVRQMEMQVATMTRLQSQNRSRQEALSTLEAEVASLTQEGDGGVATLERLRQELESLRSETEPAEGELEHLRSRQRSLREQLMTDRTQLFEAERAFLEAQSSAKLRQDEIEALRVTIAGEGFQIEAGRLISEAGPQAQQSDLGLPPVRGAADFDVELLREHAAGLRQHIRALGPVNEQAEVDYDENRQRYDFLTGQVADLDGSQQTLLSAIDELENNIRERLKDTFTVVDSGFQRYFESFFNGGKAHLSLTQPEDFANTGIEIVAQPPGKRVNTLAMLSGGERALTSLALLLALLEAHPSPICVLDEVDAALDETNVGRFVEALKALEKRTQFVIITHNPRTVEAADVIYGVSMGQEGTSRILSLRLNDSDRN